MAVLPKPRRHLLSRDETAGIVLGLCAPFNSSYPFEITGKSDTLLPQSRLLSEKVCRTDRITVDIHQFAARFIAQAKARLFGPGSVGLEAMCGGLQINHNLRQPIAGAV